MAMQSIKEKGDSVDPRMENLMNEIYYKAYPERKPCVNTKTSSGDDSDSAAGSGSDSDSDEGKQHSDKESDEERTMSATLGTESTEVPSASTPKDQHTTYGEEEEEKKVAPSNDEQGTWSGSMKEAATLGTDSIEVPSATTPIDKDTTPDCEEKYAPSNYVIEPSQYKMWALGDLNKKVDELQVEKCLQNPTPPELKAIQQEAAKAVMGEINGAINNLQENQKVMPRMQFVFLVCEVLKVFQDYDEDVVDLNADVELPSEDILYEIHVQEYSSGSLESLTQLSSTQIVEKCFANDLLPLPEPVIEKEPQIVKQQMVENCKEEKATLGLACARIEKTIHEEKGGGSKPTPHSDFFDVSSFTLLTPEETANEASMKIKLSLKKTEVKKPEAEPKRPVIFPPFSDIKRKMKRKADKPALQDFVPPRT
ncbi:uncharacterized protein LOC113331840 [Papaver somniferum]|uniref:uncharacterized protein LOC113331840 n=1 Tax=Papaver somniferum TaxID=3469 RepID=UPI000E6FADC4|nr:uncharacterized protein LOC113331840 [Papaver somniferum]XP_026434276.1 uncharacterized protein LOC113331840 [Papaver somniferum]XP_026434277.1 uncharacterized protein LOC113331840 [Papaver somniferum]XP_026434278.1 uncharacterized protein LOC113331840 [Papaver somniferum]